VAFYVSDRIGGAFVDPSIDVVDQVLTELDEPLDPEHPDVSIVHKSGWSLGAFPSGLLIWEHLDENQPKHMRSVSRAEIRRLWFALAAGDLDTVHSQPWNDGYG